MAQKHIVQLIDDLDGREASETVAFALDGTRYEIDLSVENAARLRDELAQYIANARRSSRSGPHSVARGRSHRTDRQHTAAIRDWARQNGHSVGEKGRIPSNVIDAYNSTH